LFFSRRSGLRLFSVVRLNFTWCEIAEFAMNTLFVKPGDPRAGCNLSIVEAFPVAPVLRKDGRVAKEFSLKESEH
jgi:hypothetical protein